MLKLRTLSLKVIWLEDLDQQISIENADSGRLGRLDIVSYAAPCEDFSRIAARSQGKRLPAVKLKSALNYWARDVMGCY